jgi:prepilin-type N-terminal cleavage/methylation domain-containing protein
MLRYSAPQMGSGLISSPNSSRKLPREMRPDPVSGFTLVELLVVIAIIGILVALLLPAVQAAREAARRTQCMNRLKQIALSCVNHHDVKKRFPSAVIHYPDKVSPTTKDTFWGYLVQILPYMEEQSLLDKIDLRVFWQVDPNKTFLYSTPVPFFRCPTQPDLESTFTDPPGGGATTELSALRAHYMGVMGAKTKCPTPPISDGFPANTYTATDCGGSGGVALNGVITITLGDTYSEGQISLKSVTDGSTHTLMVGEISWLVGPQRIWAVGTATGQTTKDWTSFLYTSKNVLSPLNFAYRAPTDEHPNPCTPCENNDLSFGSLHPGGAHFALCDASVQFVKEDIAIELLRALASRKSGESTEGAF